MRLRYLPQFCEPFKFCHLCNKPTAQAAAAAATAVVLTGR